MENIKNVLWEKIDEKKDELISLCSKLISINSENPPGKMEEVTSFICSYLDDKGISYEIVRPREDRPNIIAKMGNKGGKTLIINGHSDVVPVGDLLKWDFDPFSGEVVDGKVLGRGTSDMKGGLASALFAMGLLKDENIHIDGEIVLTVVPDEETGGEYGTSWLVENGYCNGDYCIIAEPTDIDNIEVGQRGQIKANLCCEGVSAHGSLWPYVGDNAIVKLMGILGELNKLTELEGIYDDEIQKVIDESKEVAEKCIGVKNVGNIIDHVTVNIGNITGGTKRNMVADYAEAQLDIRIPLGVTSVMVIDEIERILRELNVDGVTYDVVGRSEANKVSVKSELVQSVKENAQNAIGRNVTATYQWASSDAMYFRKAGIDTIQYGPSNTEGIHSYNETVDVEDLINASKVYVGAVLDLL